MQVTLLYFEGCPGWRTAEARLREALALSGAGAFAIAYRKVETPEEAEQVGFHGSPSILLDGRDPFAAEDAPVGLSCRVYETPDGLQPAPSVEQLLAVLQR